MAVRCGAGSLVYLDVVCVGEWLHKPNQIVLMICSIVSKSDYHRSDELFGLTVRLRMVRRCCEVLNFKDSAYFSNILEPSCVQLSVRRKEEMLYGIVQYSKEVFEISVNIVIDDGMTRVSFKSRSLTTATCRYLLVFSGSGPRICVDIKPRGSDGRNIWSRCWCR